MKANVQPLIRLLFAALLAGAGFAPALSAGPAILMYPLARAFGSPSESELAKCRQAFAELQAGLGASRVAVVPVMFADGSQRSWRADLAASVIQQASSRTSARFETAAAAPTTFPAKLGHNQLRYLWERAEVYGQWVRDARPPGDYVWICEIWGHDGKVAAIHVYLLAATGQVAYCRLFNSHQFGPNLPLDDEAPIQLLVKQLFKDLPREPEKVFPPYGVG